MSSDTSDINRFIASFLCKTAQKNLLELKPGLTREDLLIWISNFKSTLTSTNSMTLFVSNINNKKKAIYKSLGSIDQRICYKILNTRIPFSNKKIRILDNVWKYVLYIYVIERLERRLN